MSYFFLIKILIWEKNIRKKAFVSFNLSTILLIKACLKVKFQLKKNSTLCFLIFNNKKKPKQEQIVKIAFKKHIAFKKK